MRPPIDKSEIDMVRRLLAIAKVTRSIENYCRGTCLFSSRALLAIDIRSRKRNEADCSLRMTGADLRSSQRCWKRNRIGALFFVIVSFDRVFARVFVFRITLIANSRALPENAEAIASRASWRKWWVDRVRGQWQRSVWYIKIRHNGEGVSGKQYSE